MEVSLYLSFLVLAIGLIIVPGPNVLLIISTSLLYGKKAALYTVAGTTAAMAVQLALAALATSALVHSVAQGFWWLKWLGVVYLCGLGLLQIVNSLKHHSGVQDGLRDKEAVFSQTEHLAHGFRMGFFVSLTNPKTIVFFAAFLPQFVSPSYGYEIQMTLLSLSFLLLAFVLDAGYGLLAARARSTIGPVVENALTQRISGGVLIGAGALLAEANRSQP